MKNSSACLATLFAFATPGLVSGLEHASLEVVQLNATNNNQTHIEPSTAVTIMPGATPGVRIRGSNRGDVDMAFTPNHAEDPNKGVMITSVINNGRNNVGGGGPDGITYATSHAEISGGFYLPTQAASGGVEPDGGEFNIDVAVAWFPYSEGWLGGHAKNSANGGALTTLYSNPLIRAGEGMEFVDHRATDPGIATLDLRGLESHGVPATSANGVILTIGGKNEDNYAMSRDNADGTFSLTVKDNGTTGASSEQDGVAFVYVPIAAVGSGYVRAVGRIQSDASAEVSGGDFTVTKEGTGRWLLKIEGQTEASGTLIVSADGGRGLPALDPAPNTLDNIVSYEWSPADGGWIIESRDLDQTVDTVMALSPALEDGATPDEDMFSFVFLADEPVVALTSMPFEVGVSATLPQVISAAPTGQTPGSVQQMEFFVNGQPIGTDSSAPYQVGHTFSTPGYYQVEARATLQGGTVVRSVLREVRAEALTPVPVMPGYSAAILDGGDAEVNVESPASANPAWAYASNTQAPDAFTTPGNISGEPALSVNGLPLAFNSGVLLATNYAGSNFGDTSTRGSIDNILAPRNEAGNYALGVRDTLQGSGADPTLQPESGRFALGFFPYADGWIGAHIGTDLQVIDGSSNLPAGITFTNPGAGIYNIFGLPKDGNLIAFTSGADSDNVATTAEKGGEWVVQSRDNSQDPENSAFSFLFIPKESRQVLSGKVANDATLTPLNDGLQAVGATCTAAGSTYEIQFGDGNTINPSTAALFLAGDSDAGNGFDNVYSYNAAGNKFVVFSHDMPGLAGSAQTGGFRFLAVPFSPVQVSGQDVELTTVKSSAKERSADNTLEFRLTRFTGFDSPLTVNYTVSGTANSGDYQPLPLTATFAAGEPTATIIVMLIDDTEFELEETFGIELQPGTGYSLGISTSGSGIIRNADSLAPVTTLTFQNGLNGYAGTFSMSIGKSHNRSLVPRVDENGQPVLDGSGKPIFDEVFGDPIYGKTLGSVSSTLGLDGYPGNEHATDPAQDSPDYNVIVRFDDLFGNGPGQIPPGAKIAKAEIFLTTHNGGNSQSGGPFVVDRLIEPVDENTTYGSVDNPDPGFEGVRNISTGFPVAGFGSMSINETLAADVSEIVRSWAETPATTPAYGLSVYAGGTTDGWTICSQAHANMASRPRLVVSYVPQQTKTYTFLADKSARVVGGNSTEDGSLIHFAFIDLTSTNQTAEALMRFPVEFGDLEGQIPAGEEIVRAELVLSTATPLEGGSGDAHSPGPVSIHRMYTDWQVDTTYPQGPVPGVDFGSSISTASGLGQGAITYFDVTDAVQAWKHGQDNLGLNIKPQTENGWQFHFPGSPTAGLAPYIRVVTIASGTGGPSGFDEWASGNGIGGATQESDMDKDGIVALLEYALGFDPQAFNGLPQYQIASGTGSISFAKGAAAAADPRVSYKIQSSTNLSLWTDETATVDNSSVISLSAPVGSGKKFHRLVVSYSAF